MLLKNFCVQKNQLLELPWEVIEISMGLILGLRHMVFIGPQQYLMKVVPDSLILQMEEKCSFYNLTWEKAMRFLSDVLKMPNDFK